METGPTTQEGNAGEVWPPAIAPPRRPAPVPLSRHQASLVKYCWLYPLLGVFYAFDAWDHWQRHHGRAARPWGHGDAAMVACLALCALFSAWHGVRGWHLRQDVTRGLRSND